MDSLYGSPSFKQKYGTRKAPEGIPYMKAFTNLFPSAYNLHSFYDNSKWIQSLQNIPCEDDYKHKILLVDD